jgi:glycosyltransferase involved in cell wall biosynthesis
MMLAIIVPCFNEAIRFNVSQWQSVVEKFSNCHWFFVNDGSTDNTSLILKGLVGENIHCIDISSNVGKGNAIKNIHWIQPKSCYKTPLRLVVL